MKDKINYIKINFNGNNFDKSKIELLISNINIY